MSSLPIYKRGVPWPFTFRIKETDGTYRNLNGYTLYFAVKKKLDTVVTDDAANTLVYKTSAVINTSVTSKQIIVPKTDTDVDAGTYFVGAKLVSGSIEVPIDTKIQVELTTNNRAS
jgi:hypothetical protein